MLTFPVGLEDKRGFPSGSGVMPSAIHLQCWRHRRFKFYPWVGKIPWRREWQLRILAWRIPKESKPGGLQSQSRTLSDLAHTHRTLQFSRSVVSNSVTPWTVACQASLFITNSWSLFQLMSIESVMPSNHLILCRPLLLLPSIFPSIRVFSNEQVLCIRGPKYWSFSFSITPSNEYSGLISFRMDWLDLLAVQETLKSFLQDHISKASILQLSAFFVVQLSHGIRVNILEWNSIWSCIYVLLEFRYRCLCGVIYLFRVFVRNHELCRFSDFSDLQQ